MDTSCWEIIETLSTVGIFGVAWIQLGLMRSESKKERTLNMCFAYDSDPTLSSIVKKYRTAPDTLDDHDRNTLLNYFDVMAIGVGQNSYDFAIIYPQFKNIIPKISREFGIDQQPDNFPDLLKFIERIEQNKREQSSV